ncbi:MAG: hypothetical protein HYU67_02450 [Flavobacteriia bacterium]|nr:hypothetical protein [Flavobacteriia bacterium]
MRKILLISFVTILFSCSISQKEKPQLETKENDKIIYPEAELSDEKSESAPFNIINTNISGNYMEFEVEYSGGCKEHDFKLIGEKNITKTQPPKRKITLIHNTFDDRCKSIVRKKIKFSISVLSNNGKLKPITLELINSNEIFSYMYE